MKYYLPRRLYLRYLLQSDIRSPRQKARLAFWYRLASKLYRIKRNPFRRKQLETHTIYIHIPKTGGNSVKYMVYGARSRFIGLHTPAWEYRNAAPDLYDRMFVFATVRHPLMRLQSAFNFLKCGGMSKEDAQWAEKWLGGYETVTQMLRAMCDPQIRYRLMHWVHFIPQSYFLCDLDGRRIVKHLISVEDFETGMQGICERLHIPYYERHDNVTPIMPKAPRYDDETIQLCYHFYRRDYELLGYAPNPEAGKPIPQRVATLRELEKAQG